MLPEENAIEVVIEYDGFIAGRELSEIIEVLDEALWYEMEDFFIPGPFRYRYLPRYAEPPPLFCISEAKYGSLILTGAIGGAAATYCFNRFEKGFRQSGFGREIERFGLLLGEQMAGFIARLNQRLEGYANYARRNESRIKGIRARKVKSDRSES